MVSSMYTGKTKIIPCALHCNWGRNHQVGQIYDQDLARAEPDMTCSFTSAYLWCFRGPCGGFIPHLTVHSTTNHSSCVFIIFSFLAHVTGCTKPSMVITETSVNSWELLAFASGGGRMGASQKKLSPWLGEAMCSPRKQIQIALQMESLN